MTFSEMLCSVRNIQIEAGDLKGICCVCGKYTQQGHRKKFGVNFTAGNYLQEGDVICPECYHLVCNSNEYRRSMFLLTQKEFKKFKKAEMKEVIFNLPNEPFYIYFTKTYQKNGAIRLNDCFNVNNKGNIKFLMDYDIITANLNIIRYYCSIVRDFRKYNINKKSLETGEFTTHDFKVLSEVWSQSRTREYINFIKNHVNNPIWELCVYIEE